MIPKYISYFILIIAFCFISSTSSTIGVAPSKLPLYEPNEDFTCFDGSLSIPFEMVNDDYCDCPDGTDEPGTSACVNGSFHCVNRGYHPADIPTSRVNDYICDCCDGSDEYRTNKCTDICDILGAEALAEAARQKELISKGNSLRLQLSAEGKQLRNQKEVRLAELDKEKLEADTLKNEAETLKQSAEAAEQEALDIYREIERREKEAEKDAEKEVMLEEAKEAFNTIDSNGDGKIQEGEMLESIKTGHNIKLDDEDNADDIKFYMDSKAELTWDEFHEKIWNRLKPLFMLKKGIFVPPADTEASDKNDLPDLQDEKSHLEEYPNEKDEESAAEDEDEETGDEDTGDDGRLDAEDSDIGSKPVEENIDSKYDDETIKLINEAKEARHHFEECERNLRDIDREISQLRDSLKKDYGPDDEFFPLDGQCFTYTDREYNYKLCPFDQVLQSGKNGGSETSLGSWGGWTAPGSYLTMMYERGQSCWNGPQRSAKVHVICGLENEVISAAEPNKCEYELEFKTPAACKRTSDSAAFGDVHDEL